MIIIKLQGLPLDAMSIDVRLYFEGLTIPDGGVHIIGGDYGTVFIEFASDEDARLAMSRDGGLIKNSPIKLLLSSRTEMAPMIDVARQQKLQHTIQQQALQQQTQFQNQFQHLMGNNNTMQVVNPTPPPDQKARMSGMRGGDDKLFANKRCVLAASNIPYRATSKDIIDFFLEFNIMEDSIRRRYNQKGQPTADAKIAFSSPDAAMKALKMMNKKNLCGRPVFLKPV